LNKERCVERCPIGFFHDKLSMLCRSCKERNCDTCTYEGEFCTSCVAPLLLLNGKCIDKCPISTHVLVSGADGTQKCV